MTAGKRNKDNMDAPLAFPPRHGVVQSESEVEEGKPLWRAFFENVLLMLIYVMCVLLMASLVLVCVGILYWVAITIGQLGYGH